MRPWGLRETYGDPVGSGDKGVLGTRGTRGVGKLLGNWDLVVVEIQGGWKVMGVIWTL